jgi:hypothetical protein
MRFGLLTRHIVDWTVNQGSPWPRNRRFLNASRRQQRQAFFDPFPVLAGSLVKQYVICGKSGCRCQRGQKHGPLFYLYWKEQGRSRSLYVPREKAVEIRRQIQDYRTPRR